MPTYTITTTITSRAGSEKAGSRIARGTFAFNDYKLNGNTISYEAMGFSQLIRDIRINPGDFGGMIASWDVTNQKLLVYQPRAAVTGTLSATATGANCTSSASGAVLTSGTVTGTVTSGAMTGTVTSGATTGTVTSGATTGTVTSGVVNSGTGATPMVDGTTSAALNSTATTGTLTSTATTGTLTSTALTGSLTSTALTGTVGTAITQPTITNTITQPTISLSGNPAVAAGNAAVLTADTSLVAYTAVPFEAEGL